MKLLLLLLTILFAKPIEKTPKQEEEMQLPSFTVTGKVTHSSSYCGGMAPTPEMQARYRKRNPYAGFKLYFRLGSRNDFTYPIVDSVMTDTAGRFAVTLPHGEYTILRKEQLDTNVVLAYENSKYVRINKDCMRKWVDEGLRTVKVFNYTDSVDFHFSKPCFLPEGIPCLNYVGPYPP